ncbi:MAG TPA: hypothetical protein VLB82_05435 [Thermodesulfobacteriota bacterium]|nr:hypothetical protein [Thermodesulfobacteriota bacterium]
MPKDKKPTPKPKPKKKMPDSNDAFDEAMKGRDQFGRPKKKKLPKKMKRY